MREFDAELEPREIGEGMAEEHSIKIHNIYKMRTQFRPLNMVITDPRITLKWMCQNVKHVLNTRIFWEREDVNPPQKYRHHKNKHTDKRNRKQIFPLPSQKQQKFHEWTACIQTPCQWPDLTITNLHPPSHKDSSVKHRVVKNVNKATDIFIPNKGFCLASELYYIPWNPNMTHQGEIKGWPNQLREEQDFRHGRNHADWEGASNSQSREIERFSSRYR